MCVDLDLFKNVNDSFGHPVGDRLLKAVAERLRSGVRGDNLVARLGGDEFAIVLASDVSPNEVSDFSDRLIAALSARYDLDGLDVVVGASVGIALSPGDGTTSRGTDAQRRHGALSGQGGWRRRPPFLRTRDGPAGAERAATWNATCAGPSPTASSSCITSRWWISPPTGSAGSNRFCAGAIPTRA